METNTWQQLWDLTTLKQTGTEHDWLSGLFVMQTKPHDCDRYLKLVYRRSRDNNLALRDENRFKTSSRLFATANRNSDSNETLTQVSVFHWYQMMKLNNWCFFQTVYSFWIINFSF